MNLFKKALFILVPAVLLLPVFQKLFNLVDLFPLNGAFYTTPPPALSWQSWKTGEYQQQYEKNLNDSIGLKPFFVRAFNQMDFSLFSIPHAERVVVGKKDYLFEELYIKGVLGRDFIGNPVIDRRTKQLRELQEKLWRQKHILMLVIFTPDKGTFYEEYIPDRFLARPKRMSNYRWNKKKLEENQVNFIDFNDWFLRMKDTSRYILYPKTGIHWSSYGACLAADSLSRYLEIRLSARLPRIVRDSIWLSSTTRDRDADIWEGMNLMWRIPTPKMAYMTMHYDKPEGMVKPSALFIGDSFYFIWAYGGYIENLFSNSDFWYYDHDIYNGAVNTGRKVAQVNLLNEIDRQNVIIFLQTNGGYGIVGYNFVDRLLNALDSAAKTGKISAVR